MTGLKVSTPERLEAWLEERSNPHALSGRELYRRNKHYLQHNFVTVYDAIAAGASEDGAYRTKTEIKADFGHTPFVVEYTVSDVKIIEPCLNGEHDWTDWSYDYMGGDIRECKTCHLHEFI